MDVDEVSRGRAMSDHVLTTSGLRAYFCHVMQEATGVKGHSHHDDFDRWKARNDAEVAAKALEDAADHYKSGVFVGRDDYARAWLRSRAAQIRQIGAEQ